MVDRTELSEIMNDVDAIKDKTSLGISDKNRLMLIAGRLSGVVRSRKFGKNHEGFINMCDDFILSNSTEVHVLFYVISVLVEIMDSNVVEHNPKRRYRSRKKKNIDDYIGSSGIPEIIDEKAEDGSDAEMIEIVKQVSLSTVPNE